MTDNTQLLLCEKRKYNFNYYKAKEKYVNLFEKKGIYEDILRNVYKRATE